jgi:hypothetical protein
MNPTHIVLTYPSQETELLYRASDGMMIAEAAKCVVIFGESPNKKTSRVFLDHESAYAFLRFVAGLDASGFHPLPDYRETWAPDGPLEFAATIEERNQEGMIVLPPDSLELVSNGIGSTVRPLKAN